MGDQERQRLVAMGRDRLRAALDKRNSIPTRTEIKMETDEISPPAPMSVGNVQTDAKNADTWDAKQSWIVEKEHLTNLYQTASMESARLRVELENAKISNDSSQNRIIELERDGAALKGQIAELLANNESLFSQLQQQTTRIGELESSLLEAQVTPRDKMVAANQASQTNQAGDAKLRADYEILVQEIESKQEEMSQLHDLLASSRSELKETRAQLSTAQSENLSILQSLEREVEEYKKLADSKTSDPVLGESMELIKKENVQIKQQMEEVQSRFMQVMDEKLFVADALDTERLKVLRLRQQLDAKLTVSSYDHSHEQKQSHDHSHRDHSHRDHSHHDHSHHDHSHHDHSHHDHSHEQKHDHQGHDHGELKPLIVPHEYRTEWVRSPIGSERSNLNSLLQESVTAFPPCRRCIDSVEVVL
jgi:chromosome segregation ATPase